MIVSASEMQAAEKRLFATGVEAEPLMDEAGFGCAQAILQFFPSPGRLTLFCGKGNNAGDAYVIGSLLKKQGWVVEAVESHDKSDMTALAQKKRKTLAATSPASKPPAGNHHVIVDGLLGIGTDGPLRGKIAELARQMNEIRRTEHATTFAVDMPSGIGQVNGVTADFTLSICEFKSELLGDDAVDQVGRLVKIPLPRISEYIEEATPDRVETAREMTSWLPSRGFGNHKGTAGRVAIIAGSRGLTGAAVLSSLGALRGGAGLVSVFVEEKIYPIIAASAPPEVMVRPVVNFSEVTEFNADVLAIGPGLGDNPRPDILDLIQRDPRPAVIDADGLNWIAASETFPAFAGPRLLTPHPGEMKRLHGDFGDRSRREIATEFAQKHKICVLLKGSRSVIADPGHGSPLYYNSTGHPGMATGGIGDVLTGLSAALIAQGVSLARAATLGSWLVGRAAEIAIFSEDESPESLTATVIANNLGKAFNSLRRAEF